MKSVLTGKPIKSIYIKDALGGVEFQSKTELSKGDMKSHAKKFRAKNGIAGDVTVHELCGKSGYLSIPLVILHD